MAELQRNVRWERWISFLVLSCAVLAFKRLDIQGNTRQFISKVNHDCRDFKGVLNKCHVWKDMGFCFKYRRQMQHVCNRTCQYCVPGQKQWQVINIKGVLGGARKPFSAHGMSSALQTKIPAVQILGKEREPQVENAASAIATQLQDDTLHDISASPKVLGQLAKFHISLQNTSSTAKTKASTSNKTKGKMPTTPQALLIKGQQNNPAPTEAPSIGGTTQVSEQSKDRGPVVVLMGYELGEKSSKKVNDVLTNTDPRAKNNVGLRRVLTGRQLALRENSTSFVKGVQEDDTTARAPSEETIHESDLQEISELLDNAAASARKGLRNKEYMHDETNAHNPDINALQAKMHAPSLKTQVLNALQSSVTHSKEVENPDILPISSDDSVNQQAFEQMHAQQDMINATSMADASLKLPSLEGMPSDIAGMVVGNKHGNINNPIGQMNRPFRKPAVPNSSGKQVTLTINERPGTGEAVFKVQNSPHSTGVSYTTEGNQGNMLPPTYRIQNEREQARTKSEEEETKIREATDAIKNVIKLFDRDHRRGHTRLIHQATQDFPGDSKSLEASQEMAGIQSEYDAEVAQAQNQDRAKASAQALSQQSGAEFSPNEVLPGAPPPNYAVVSTSDSKDWKNLAHVLATQLKRVLNHMEDREMENRYEKEKIQEEMMLMAQQQMSGRDEYGGPDDDDGDDDDDDGDRDKRQHYVHGPYVKKRSKNVSKNIILTDKKSNKTNSSRKSTENNLVHRAVKTLSRLEMLHKSKNKNAR